MALWGCFTELCRSPTTSAFSYRLKSRRAGVIVVPTCRPFRGLVFFEQGRSRRAYDKRDVGSKGR